MLKAANLTLETLTDHLLYHSKESAALKEHDLSLSSPFSSHLAAEITTFAFRNVKLSRTNTQQFLDLLDIIPGFYSPFSNPNDLLAAVDSIPFGELQSFEVKLTPEFVPDKFYDTRDEESDGEMNAGQGMMRSRGIPPASWFRESPFNFTTLSVRANTFLPALTTRTQPSTWLERLSIRTAIEWFQISWLTTGNIKHRCDLVDSLDLLNFFLTANFSITLLQETSHAGVIPIGLILSSDKIQISVMAGQAKAYPRYLILGAFKNTVQVDTSLGTMIQLFQLPILLSTSLQWSATVVFFTNYVSFSVSE